MIMSYESKMLEQMAMPTRKQVGHALLRSLLRHGGVITEFNEGEAVVRELADVFGLSEGQRAAVLKRVYRRENRLVESRLWHRLLFRAADTLARDKLVSRPKETFGVTKKKEWMLTESGFDEALRLSDIPVARKELLPIRSFEVQKLANSIASSPKPENYDPIEPGKRLAKREAESVLRGRGFRIAVVEAYHFKCAVCGLKIAPPDSLLWEVEAAHIVPNHAKGRDDIWNGIALCRLHHWAFDVGWFTILDDYRLRLSGGVSGLPPDQGVMGNYEFIRALADSAAGLSLPEREDCRPDRAAVRWHQENVFKRKHPI